MPGASEGVVPRSEQLSDPVSVTFARQFARELMASPARQRRPRRSVSTSGPAARRQSAPHELFSGLIAIIQAASASRADGRGSVARRVAPVVHPWSPDSDLATAHQSRWEPALTGSHVGTNME